MRVAALLIMCAFIFPAAAFAAEKLPAGFIAVSEKGMEWDKAKAFCEQKGGKLPLINGIASSKSIPKGAAIDGFGTGGGPWPEGLPAGIYWLGTEHSPRNSWAIGGGKKSRVDYAGQSGDHRAACVPK